MGRLLCFSVLLQLVFFESLNAISAPNATARFNLSLPKGIAPKMNMKTRDEPWIFEGKGGNNNGTINGEGRKNVVDKKYGGTGKKDWRDRQGGRRNR